MMIFTETKLKGAYTIDSEKIEDNRGFFARTWDKKEFEKMGLDSDLVQCSISFNNKKGTLRGMHYQENPFEESKVVRCTRGKIFDVIIDLRPQSSSFKQWFGVELDSNNHKSLYIPKGFAHGFQTLEDDCEVFYEISQYYNPEKARGISWDDKAFGIDWPLEVSVISEKDLSYPPFEQKKDSARFY